MKIKIYGHDTQIYNILPVLQFENLKPDFGKQCYSSSQAAQPKTEFKGEGPVGASRVQCGLANPNVHRVRQEGRGSGGVDWASEGSLWGVTATQYPPIVAM